LRTLEKIGMMVKFYIWLHYEEKWSLNLPKMWINKVNFNLLKLGCNDRIFERKVDKKIQKIRFKLGQLNLCASLWASKA
jgi:hypothetical protein